MTFLYYGYSISRMYLLFVGSSTLLTYSMHRLVGIDKVESRDDIGRFSIVKKYKSHILLYTILSFLGSVYYFFHLSYSYKLYSTLGILISAAYVLPILREGRRLRDIHYIKIFLIALTWAWVTEGIILLENNHPISHICLYMLERVAYFIGITLPFDIRDIRIDASSQVKTIPQRIGSHRTRSLAIGCLVFAMILHISRGYDNITAGVSFIVCYIVAIILVWYTDGEKNDYWYSGLIDGTMMIPLLVMLIITMFL